ncbi:hypothetical protein J0695_00360 [Streptomyces beijiangensis]|uniref:Secreted protein n=1 Tax=Streptomyces beijiangensis TaxID=163361 RepID=A0A939JF94_9ACTN|nr:DUF6344 domain-containing protein [Streptomyces beijiangensis]MBO0510272.1 hypothetical protein [Streptomyces beijiangensis]
MTSQAKKVWTAFTTAFFALVALLGFTTPATAAPQAVTTSAASCKPTAAEARALKALEPVAWWAIPKDRALPPTMKQRIRAEAHGSSPSTRHVPLDTDAEDEQRDTVVADAALRPELRTELRTERQTERQTELQTDRQAGLQTAGQAQQPADRQAELRSDRRAELQPA